MTIEHIGILHLFYTEQQGEFSEVGIPFYPLPPSPLFQTHYWLSIPLRSRPQSSPWPGKSGAPGPVHLSCLLHLTGSLRPATQAFGPSNRRCFFLSQGLFTRVPSSWKMLSPHPLSSSNSFTFTSQLSGQGSLL